MLTFIMPVRHPDGVSDWGRIKRLMGVTLRSIAAQDHPDWELVVVAERGTDLPPMPANTTVLHVDRGYQPLPERGEALYQAIRRDKGARVAAGLVHADPTGHVMVADYDDLVSRRLAGVCAARPQANGWFFATGYIWSGGRLAVLEGPEFHRRCGTSHIVHRRLLPVPDRATGAFDEHEADHVLGDHKYEREFERRGVPLTPLPFPGAVYRAGHEASSVRSSPLVKFVLNRASLSSPAVLADRVGRVRWFGSAMDEEFRGAPPGAGATPAGTGRREAHAPPADDDGN